MIWLDRVEGPVDRLGQRDMTWVPGTVERGRILPLSTEEAIKAGLTTERNRVQVRLPRRDLSLPARLRVRGREWQVVRSERWPSHLLLTLEEV